MILWTFFPLQWVSSVGLVRGSHFFSPFLHHTNPFPALSYRYNLTVESLLGSLCYISSLLFANRTFSIKAASWLSWLGSVLVKGLLNKRSLVSTGMTEDGSFPLVHVQKGRYEWRLAIFTLLPFKSELLRIKVNNPLSPNK